MVNVTVEVVSEFLYFHGDFKKRVVGKEFGYTLILRDSEVIIKVASHVYFFEIINVNFHFHNLLEARNPPELLDTVVSLAPKRSLFFGNIWILMVFIVSSKLMFTTLGWE